MAGLAAERSPVRRAPPAVVHVKLSEALKRLQNFLDQGQLDDAERLASAILEKRPREPQATQFLAAVSEKRGDIDRAIEVLRGSLTGASTDAASLNNLCRVLRTQGRLKESREAGEAAAAFGTLPEALSDLADTYVALGEHDLALATFERAIASRPELARARLGLAQALLMKGDFRAGWAEYEWRYRLPNTQNLLPKFKQPQWNGMALKASRLLVIAEQGFGDCIQFARYLPLVAERAKDVYVGVGAELKSVFTGIPGKHLCFERWEHIPPFEFQIPISSLPLAFGTTLATIPANVPYVFANAAKAETWRARLGERAQGRKKVGIVWQGRPAHPNDRVRSTGLGALTRLLDLENILPVSLQVGHGREQLAAHPAGARVFDAADELKDFDDTAALISQLDCVVTIDSAIAHLAGALAKRCLVMLPHAGEWRWLEGRTDSPWYPTLDLVRQDESRTWDSVVARVIERLGV